MDVNDQITIVGDRLIARAPAKINLALLVAGKRSDGFHEIETVMAKINWYDEILIEPGTKSGIELVCRGPEWAPPGKDNLVWRAASMLLDNCPGTADIKITLTKNIPAGTGLGSASSDAAATLLALNRYFDLNLDGQYLLNSAAKLGSDVPFFLGGPLAICTGKGEKIEEMEEKLHFVGILVVPDVSVSTQKVYANYKHNRAVYESLAAQINSHIREKRVDLLTKMCANMLEESCFDLVESLARLKKRCESLNVGSFCLSGSGSAMFCVLERGDEGRAGEYKHKLEEEVGCRCIVVTNNRW